MRDGHSLTSVFSHLCIIILLYYYWHTVLVLGVQNKDAILFMLCKMITIVSLVTICHHTVITVFLTTYPMLYTISPWYFILGSLYFLIFFAYFSCFPPLLPSNNHQCVFWIYESVFFFVLSVHLFCGSHLEVKLHGIYLSLTYFTWQTKGSFMLSWMATFDSFLCFRVENIYIYTHTHTHIYMYIPHHFYSSICQRKHVASVP